MNNILIVIPSMGTGGAEKNVALLASHLSKQHNVSLLTFYDTDDEQMHKGHRIKLREKLPAQEKNKYTIFSEIKNGNKLFFRAKKIAKVCKEQNIDTVISFIEHANFPVAASTFLGNSATIILSVRTMLPIHNNWIIKGLIRVLYQRAKQVVVVTKQMQRFFEDKVGLRNVRVINNPITPTRTGSLPDTAKEIYKGKDTFTFINIGRLSLQKGQAHLIRSFSQLVIKYPNARLVILGEGAQRKNLETLINQLGLSENIFLPGNQKNIYPWLASSQCFVLSSLWEGFPNVLLEALSTHTPIIATDCPTGPREILAPELGVFQDISYPYYGTYGSLTSPIPSQEGERIMAQAMISHINHQTDILSNQANQPPPTFDYLYIMDLWEQAITTK